MSNGTVTYSTLGRNGRFANQILQITGTIAFALDHGKDFCFPKWEYSKWFKKPLPEGEPEGCINVPVQFHYAPIEDYPGKNINLVNGHLQSWRYFFHRWNEIKPYLTLKDEHYKTLNKYRDIIKQRTCAVHVRRTDYTTETNLVYHGVMGVDYYEEASRNLYGTNAPQDVLFVVCGDDLDWARANIRFPNMVFIEGEENVIDMFIMSFCDDNILANSSFGLCSAYFRRLNSPQVPHRVVSPSKWFNNAPVISKDVHCDDWIII